MPEPATPRSQPVRPAASARARQPRGPLDPRLKALLARAVLVYCVLALGACAWLGWGALQARQAAQGQIMVAQAAVDAVKLPADQADAVYHELVSAQEQDRKHYDGLQAIEMSTKVMQAKDEAGRLRGQQQAAQVALDAAREADRAASLRFVPLIAVFLVHAIGLALLLVANPLRRAQ